MPPPRKSKHDKFKNVTGSDLLNSLYASTTSAARGRSRVSSPAPKSASTSPKVAPSKRKSTSRSATPPALTSSLPPRTADSITKKYGARIGPRYDASGEPMPLQLMTLLSKTLREEQAVAAVNGGGHRAMVNRKVSRPLIHGPITSKTRSGNVPSRTSPQKPKLPSSARKKRGEALNIAPVNTEKQTPTKQKQLSVFEKLEKDMAKEEYQLDEEEDEDDIEWEDVAGTKENEDDDDDEDSEDEKAPEKSSTKITLQTGTAEPIQPMTLVFPGADSATPKTTKKKPNATTVLSRAEKAVRLNIHKIHLLCLLSHVSTRNKWCSDPRVARVYSSLLPQSIIDKIAPSRELLHKVFRKYGQDSAELILSRKLMDGLRYAMVAWNGGGSYTIGDTMGRAGRASEKVAGVSGSGFRTATERGIKMVSWSDIYKSDRIIEGKTDKDRFVKNLTKRFRGSRDLSAQGFTALLRSIGLDARLVCSLQPLDFTSNTSIEDNPFGETPPDNAAPTSPANNTCSAYPTYWTEVWDPYARRWISVDAVVLQLIETATLRRKSKFEPPLKDPANSLRYVVAFDPSGHAVDVTRRYAYWYNAKTSKKRVTITPEGRVWWARAMGTYKRWNMTERDLLEAQEMIARDEGEELPSRVADFKDHPVYVLERHLRVDQVLEPRIPCGTLALKKTGARGATAAVPIFGNTSSSAASVASAQALAATTAAPPPNVEYIYPRKYVKDVKSARAWYQQGRVLKIGAAPKKHVVRKPLQSDTFPPSTGSRRKLTMDSDEEDDAASVPNEDEDGKVQVGLYAFDQTEQYVPPPIGPNGEVPRNAYGNIDVFVASMVPAGGVVLTQPHIHVAARILEIDYARAIVGFEFGNEASFALKDGKEIDSNALRGASKARGGVHARARLGGIVISKKYEEAVRAVYETLVEEQAEEDKRRAIVAALSRWRRYMIALRIQARLNAEHGTVEEVEAREQAEREDRQLRRQERAQEEAEGDVEMIGEDDEDGGGFVVGEDEGGGFLAEDEGGGLLAEDDGEAGGGFLPEDDAGGFVHGEAGGFVPEEAEEAGGSVPEESRGFVPEDDAGGFEEAQNSAEANISDSENDETQTNEPSPRLSSRDIGESFGFNATRAVSTRTQSIPKPFEINDSDSGDDEDVIEMKPAPAPAPAPAPGLSFRERVKEAPPKVLSADHEDKNARPTDIKRLRQELQQQQGMRATAKDKGKGKPQLLSSPSESESESEYVSGSAGDSDVDYALDYAILKSLEESQKLEFQRSQTKAEEEPVPVPQRAGLTSSDAAIEAAREQDDGFFPDSMSESELLDGYDEE